jgi:hypothetical protein
VHIADDDDFLVLQEEPRMLKIPNAELGALEVRDQREWLAGLGLNLADDLGAGFVIGVDAVRKIEADGIDTGVHQRTHRVVCRGDRADRRNDLRPAPVCCHPSQTSDE